MGAIQSRAKFKEAFVNGMNKVKEFVKKGAKFIKKVVDTPEAKNVIDMLTKMAGTPVSVTDIISQGADIISTGTEFAENMFQSKLRKDILKDLNKFHFNSKFNRMSDLIKTRKPTG
jgi:CRISPR/Cas system endoribonuclease Cas6 (RAMP superfamily)